MVNTLLTPHIMFLEAQRIANAYNSKIDNVFLQNDRIIITKSKNEKHALIDSSDLCMSLDDFSERFIHPLVYQLLEWDRAFKLETWK